MVEKDEFRNLLLKARDKLAKVKHIVFQIHEIIEEPWELQPEVIRYRVYYSAMDRPKILTQVFNSRNIDREVMLGVDKEASVPAGLTREERTVMRIAYWLWLAYKENK